MTNLIIIIICHAWRGKGRSTGALWLQFSLERKPHIHLIQRETKVLFCTPFYLHTWPDRPVPRERKRKQAGAWGQTDTFYLSINEWWNCSHCCSGAAAGRWDQHFPCRTAIICKIVEKEIQKQGCGKPTSPFYPKSWKWQVQTPKLKIRYIEHDDRRGWLAYFPFCVILLKFLQQAGGAALTKPERSLKTFLYYAYMSILSIVEYFLQRLFHFLWQKKYK